MSRGKLYSKAREVAAAGRYGDTMLAHITPREAAILKGLGGTGIVNPATGLPEFNEGATSADGTAGGDQGQGTTDTSGHGISDAGLGGQSGGQIADLSTQDQQSLGYDVDNALSGVGFQGEALVSDHASRGSGRLAGPNEAAWGSAIGGLGRALGYMADNPVASAIDLAVGATPLGWANTLAGLTLGRENTVGGLMTGAARDATGFNSTTPAGTQTAANAAPTGLQDPGLGNDTRGGGDAYSSAINTLNEIANPKPPEDPTKGILIRNRTYNNPPPMTLANYGQQGEFQFFTPGDVAIPRFAQGGVVGMADGGFVVPADVVSGLGDGSTKAGHRRLGLGKLLEGPGTGMSDDIPAHIDGVTPARVADGEVYLSPQEVELVGGGDHKKGLARMYALMKDVRKKRTGKTSQPKPLNDGMAGGGPVTTGNSQWNFLTPQAAGNNATSDLSADVSRIQQTLAGMGQIPKQTFADGGVTQLPGGGQNVIPGVNVGYAEAIAPNDPQQQQSISNLNPTQQAATFDMEQKAGRAGWNMGTIWDTVPKFEVPQMPTFTPTQVPQIGPQGGGSTGPAPAPTPTQPQIQLDQTQHFAPDLSPINRFYMQHLRRMPEAGASEFWAAQGMTPEQMEDAIKNSPEARGLGAVQTTTAGLPLTWDAVNDIRRRFPDSNGLSAWTVPT